ncbi:hypothetical protein JG688_00005085 [Phytophthora aleatoria]|uniref:Uncharacterized protein n=1 Tax=Phytophthora aleatoria TaxID=2496075 RepID=A0A8J5J1B1_9STRA|nr:hypothetical protein JG688_00005085 [Phytophthora aleatoria]
MMQGKSRIVEIARDSYNDILKEEILPINRAVNDVSAAFAKLEEIRHAMDKLDNGSADRPRNTFANGLPNFMIRADLPGALRKVEASIRDMYQSTVEERTANALSWVRQLKEDASVENIDKGILLLDEAIRHQESGWKPRKNEDVPECYDILKEAATHEEKVKQEVKLPRNIELGSHVKVLQYSAV